MELLDRYVAKHVFGGVFAVLAVLISLNAIIGFAGETSSIGRSDYTAWYAIAYVAMSIPQNVYLIFPIAALLGGMLGLGMLASHSELIAMRAAGVSINRIMLSVIRAALLLTILAVVIGEIIAPPAIQYATLKRLNVMSAEINLNTDLGLWARDGNTFIHVRRVDSDGRLVSIKLYTLDDTNALIEKIHAASADYQLDSEQWLLRNVTRTTFSEEGMSTDQLPSLEWKTLVDPDMVKVVSVTPENLSAWRLYEYIRYLKKNDLDASHYELTFWNKIVTPLTIAVMISLAVPFVFGTLRQSTMGKRILVGFMIGVVFYILDRLVGQVGIVYQLPPVVAASLPTLIVAVFGIFLIRRVR